MNTKSKPLTVAINLINHSGNSIVNGENCSKQLRTMFSQSFFLEENERRRFAEAIHEQICQILALSKMKIGVLREKSSSNNCYQTLEEISKHIDWAIEEMRSLAFDLSPLVLYDLGIEKAIECLVEKFQEDYHIPIKCHIKPGPKSGVPLEILLFRALRELLLNSIIHASPHTINVLFENTNGDIKIQVIDDGIGFDVSNILPNKNGQDHFGIINIQEKLKHIHGKLIIDSAPGKGSHFSILLNSNHPACQTMHILRAPIPPKKNI